KWSYLDSMLNKIIASSSKGVDNEYSSIKGVSLSIRDLQNMQDMAAAKVSLIQGVIESCLAYVDGPVVLDTDGLTKNCSLDGLQVDFTTTVEGKPSTAKVDVLESDVYYLVRLPFSKNVYDGQIATGTSNTTNLSYQDIITNQVNGIYSERCGGSVINIDNYCETAANVQRAVTDYVGDDKGQMYYRYRVLAGAQADLCMSFDSTTANMSVQDCSIAALFGFDESTRQVKVRFPESSGNYQQGNIMCLKATEVSNYGSSTNYGHHLSLDVCQNDTGHSESASMVYWEPVKVQAAAGSSSDVSIVMLRDANYDELSISDSHTNCATSNERDEVGKEVIDQSCSDTDKPDARQQWQQLLGQFYLEASS
ncbi:MAG: hypothetical protein KDI36_19260, partial [Pseudomonadales bacterium]|nr:hypothetical protein [Pseudomonadales bacterium]